MALSTWSSDAIHELETLSLEGFNAAVIARKMKRSYTSVYGQVLKFNARQSSGGHFKKSTVDNRECLHCHCVFRSSDCGNRICERCSYVRQGYVGLVYD